MLRRTASFGAALAMPMAGAQAAVVDLSFTPESFPYTRRAAGTVRVTGPGFVGGFYQYNDNSFQALTVRATSVPGFQFRTTFAASVVTAGQKFAGVLLLDGATFGGPGATGEITVGFKAAGGELGWIRLDVGAGFRSDVTYLAGAVETVPGESITLGETAADSDAVVPLPATLPLAALGVLALGAAGLRRKRMAKARPTPPSPANRPNPHAP